MPAVPILPTRLIANTATTYTLTAFAQNAVITSSNAAAQTITIPESTTLNFPLGTIITVIQTGAGAVTVAKTGSDTIVGTVSTTAAGDTLFVTKTTATGWHVGLAT